MFETFDGHPFTAPSQVQSGPYRREPYVRATFPDGRTVDGKVRRWSPSHVLIHWEPSPGSAPSEAWIPASWAVRIDREDSAWRDPYDLH